LLEAFLACVGFVVVLRWALRAPVAAGGAVALGLGLAALGLARPVGRRGIDRALSIAGTALARASAYPILVLVFALVFVLGGLLGRRRASDVPGGDGSLWKAPAERDQDSERSL
jgi:hypothetical protein